MTKEKLTLITARLVAITLIVFVVASIPLAIVKGLKVQAPVWYVMLGVVFTYFCLVSLIGILLVVLKHRT